MKLRHAARQAALTFAVVILPFVLGCGDDATGTDDDETDTEVNALIGTWAATSAMINGVEVLVGTDFAFTVTLKNDATYTLIATGDTDLMVCGATDCTENYSWSSTSTSVTLCDPGCDPDNVAQYTITGNTMVWTAMDEASTITVTFVRVSVNPVAGTWSATSITIDDVEVLAGTSLSLTSTLNSDGTFSESVTGDTFELFCDEGITSCTDSGTYLYNVTHLTFCDPGCDEFLGYTISGNTVTVTFIADLGVRLVLIFTKT